MKFVCIGYYDEEAWAAMPDAERNAFMDGCLAYDDELQKADRVAGGEALDGSSNARTLRFRDGKVLVTDGPFAESKEQIGGFLVLEADDLDHAVRLMSLHPGVKAGPFEIRAIVDMTDTVHESRQRRSGTNG